MDSRTAEMRDTTLLAVAAVLGVVLVPAFGIVGMPIVAAAVIGLAYRGHALTAAIVSAVGVGVVAALDATAVVYATIVIVGILLAVSLLPRVNVQAVGAMLAALVAVAGVASDSLLAWRQHMTLWAANEANVRAAMAQFTAAIGPSASVDTGDQTRLLEGMMMSAWPSVYVVTGLVMSVVTIAAIGWAAHRAGRDVGVPALGMLDLTPHVVWPLVIGLLLSAVSRSSLPYAVVMGAVGLNLLLCARALFFIQGMGVSAGVLNRAGVGRGGRIFALAALAAIDAVTLAVSLVGLVDFWLNIRRLPRDGSTPSETATETPE